MPSFRINSKKVAITYPQCSISKEQCLLLLKDNAYYHDFIKYCIAQERHEDGGYHLHVYLQYDRKLNIKSPKCFDMVNGEETIHGNYQSCRYAKNWLEYIVKDDKHPLTNIEDLDDVDQDAWQLFYDEPDPDKAMEAIADKGKELVKLDVQIQRVLKRKRDAISDVEYIPRYSPNMFNENLYISLWFDDNVGITKDRYQLLVITGPPCVGKTSYIRSLGPHIYIQSDYNLHQLMTGLKDSKNMFIVWDDIHWVKDLPNKLRNCLLGMGQQTLSDKYMKKEIVNVTIPSIVINNGDNEFLLLLNQSKWQNQYVHVHISEPTFFQV